MTPASERFRKITGHGVIPAPSGAGALLHAEDGLDCLLVSASSAQRTRPS
jgi:hypothetical protein